MNIMEDIPPLILVAVCVVDCMLSGQRHHIMNYSPFSQTDTIGAMMIVWRVTERENYQLCSVQHCCATVVHSEHLRLTVVCWLNLAFLWLCYVLQFMCLIQLFGIILCYSLCVCVLFLC